MPSFQINGVHHLALVCADMERTVEFYTRILGMRLTKGFDLEGYGQHFFFDMGNGSELAFFWFNDAADAQPGIASAGNIVGRAGPTISSAHGSMNHLAFNVDKDDIVEYRERLISKGVDCSPLVNHNDVVTGEESRTAKTASEKTWLQSFYFFDPDGVMLEFCATLQPGIEHADLPVNAAGLKANGQPVTGLTV
jgi:catechol 2,3-dioxygenase-like lactoylglutathione lyase family enzyme